MARPVTSPPTPTTGTPASNPQPTKIPHDRIAQRAYEKWCQRGRPAGTDLQDWLDAERELRAEMTRQTGTVGTPMRR